MRQRVKAFLDGSVTVRAARAVQNALGRFLASSALGAWFGRERSGARRIDRVAERFFNSRFCDFIRSSALLGLLMKIPDVAFWMLWITAAGAMCLPTVLVMLCALATAALTLTALIFRKERLPVITDGMIFWALWAGVVLLYTFIGYGGSSGVLSGGIRFVMMPMLPCAYILLSRPGRMERGMKILTGLSFAVGAYGLYQYLFGSLSTQWTDTTLFSEQLGRLTATFENPNIYGEFLVLMFPVAITVACCAKRRAEKIFYFAGSALLLGNLFLTYSRGCYIALVIAVLIMLWRTDRRLLWIGVALLLISPLFLPENVLARVQSIGNLDDTSTAYRVNIWKGCLAMLSKYWWIGIGIGDAAFRKIYEPYALTLAEDAPHAHNLYLQTMCESGVIGLLILLLVLVFLFRTAHTQIKSARRTTPRRLSIALCAAWIGLLAQGLTDFIFYNNNLFCIMMITLGAMSARIGEERQDV